jgi:hypothetical protein
LRNNEDRLADLRMAAGAEPVAAIQQQPQMSFVVPTEFVELPSKGLYYPPSHPLHKQETIEIRQMTAKDEDTLTSKVLLKKGVAIDKMLNDIIINKAIKVDDLLVGDKNAVILAARISGYGAEYETKVACPSCEKNSLYEFDLNQKDIITPLSTEQLSEVGISVTDSGTFVVSIPNSKNIIEIRLITGKDEKAMVQKLDQKKANNLSESNITDQLKMLIVSVNGSSESRTIHDFIWNMPAKEAKFLRSIMKNVTPNIKLEQTFVCSNCNFETEMEVPFTQDFFWPK